jgi:pyrroloquinoline quinone biosynthesis protein D
MPPAPIPLHARPKLSPRVRLQKDRVSQQPVLLYPEGILELNETAQEIVARCDGEQTVSQIVDGLAGEYEAPREELLPDVLACLQDLQRRQLLALTEG